MTASDLAQARLSIHSISQPLKDGNVGEALSMLAGGLQVFLKVKLFRAEKEELEKILQKAVYKLNLSQELKKLFPEQIDYTPGQELALYKRLLIMAAGLQAREEKAERQARQDMREKKSKLIRKGLQFLESGELKRAVLLFRRLIAELPVSPEEISRIGSAFLAASQDTFAFEFLDQALRLAPDDIALRLRMAALLRRLHKTEEAEEQYRKALELGARDEAIYFNLGRVYLEMRKWNEALDAARQAVKINPEFEEGKKLLAYIEQKMFG